MSNKKILITGGSKGIGLATAKKFYEASYEVIICARNPEALAAAKQEMPALHTYTCDVSNKEEVQGLGKEVNETFGALDVLVNNAGVFIPGSIHEEEEGMYEKMMRTNMDSAYYLTRSVLPLMQEKEAGSIVNMASIASIGAYANGGSYSISKYALLGFSKNLREEMKPFGIRVMSFLPGATYTASWEGSGIDPQRLMPAEDIAQLVFTSVHLTQRTVVEDIVIRPHLGDL